MSRYRRKQREKRRLEQQRQVEEAKRRAQTKRTAKKKLGTHRQPHFADPSDADDTETRWVQPYESSKTYTCPGCNQPIPPGTGHLVAVPASAPDLRRHWHRSCWQHRARRR